MAQDSEQIVVVRRVRPVKVLACICGVIACILVIIALSGEWLRTDDPVIMVTDSLWENCEQGRDPVCIDPASNERFTDWLNAVRAFAIISLGLCVGATGIRIFGCISSDRNTKLRTNLVAMILMAAAILSLMISLIIFPVKTMDTLRYRESEKWQFHWAYGVGWGGVIFMLGFIILLFLPSRLEEQQNDIYEDKVYYVNSAGQYETNA